MNVNEHKELLFPTQKKESKQKYKCIFYLFIFKTSIIIENVRKGLSFHRCSKSKDNTMAKIKIIKEQKVIYKTIYTEN